MADPDTRKAGQKNQGTKWDPKDPNPNDNQDNDNQHKASRDMNTPGKAAGQDSQSQTRRDIDARADQNRGDQAANRGRKSAENTAGTDDEDFKTPASESENPDQDAQDPSKARDQRPM